MIFRTSTKELAEVFQAMTLNGIASVKLADGTEIAAFPRSIPQMGMDIPRPSEGTDLDPNGFREPVFDPMNRSYSDQQAAMARLFHEQQRDNVPDLKAEAPQNPVPHPEDPTHPDNPIDDNAVFAPDLPRE